MVGAGRFFSPASVKPFSVGRLAPRSFFFFFTYYRIGLQVAVVVVVLSDHPLHTPFIHSLCRLTGTYSVFYAFFFTSYRAIAIHRHFGVFVVRSTLQSRGEESREQRERTVDLRVPYHIIEVVCCRRSGFAVS